MGAIQFIESLDRSSLTITDAEFERNVEAAVAAIAEKPDPPAVDEETSSQRLARQQLDGAGEGSSGGQLRSVSPRPMSEPERDCPPTAIPEKDCPPTATSSRTYNGNNNNTNNNNPGSDNDDPSAAVAGLLRTIQKPLSTIGRIFGEATTPSSSDSESQIGNSQRRQSSAVGAGTGKGGASARGRGHGSGMNAEEAAARQASAETAEALRIQRAEHENVVGILASMFPALDKDLISDVVVLQEGR